MLKIFPDNDAKQVLRLKRFFMAFSSYFMWYALIIYFYYLGCIRLSAPSIMFYFIFFIIINLIIFIILRTGLNKKLGDPSLTVIQMVVGTIAAMLALYYTDQARGVVLILYLVLFIFGVFRFNTKQFVLFGCFGAISYGIVIYGLLIHHPDKLDLRIEILQLIVLIAVLSWFSVVGGNISQLRQRINRANSELTTALTKIEQLAVLDDLTGIYNRRKMMELLKHEKALADRGGAGFAICLFDLDHFKQINDNFGHIVGDNVLQLLTKEVQKEIRASDSFSRYGGEEFIVILNNTNMEGALEHAERIRVRVEEISHPDLDDERNVTISIGIVCYMSVETIERLLSRADEVLYAAKSNGRNRIEIWKEK